MDAQADAVPDVASAAPRCAAACYYYGLGDEVQINRDPASVDAFDLFTVICGCSLRGLSFERAERGDGSLKHPA